MIFIGDNVGGSGGIIGVGGGGDFIFVGGVDKYVMFQCWWCVGQIVFGILVVMQQGVSDIRVGQYLFGFDMFCGQIQW